jgi:hypothetical protein
MEAFVKAFSNVEFSENRIHSVVNATHLVRRHSGVK